MTTFNIVVYFDTTCAWCLIHQRILDRAIDLYQRTYPNGRHDDFVFSYRPFYLRPEAPIDGVPLMQAMIEKSGAEQAEVIKSQMSRIAKHAGVNLSFESKTGNTRKSHQLIWKAGQQYGANLQKELIAGIMAMHFERDGDITNEDELVMEAEKVGITANEARRWMSNENIGHVVDPKAAQARRDGVQGVPTYLINGQKTTNSQDVSNIYDSLVRIKENDVQT